VPLLTTSSHMKISAAMNPDECSVESDIGCTNMSGSSNSPKRDSVGRRTLLREKSEAYREKMAQVAEQRLEEELMAKATLTDEQKIALAEKEKKAKEEEARRKLMVQSQFGTYQKAGGASAIRRTSVRRASSHLKSRRASNLSRSSSMDSVSENDNESELHSDGAGAKMGQNEPKTSKASSRPLSIIRDDEIERDDYVSEAAEAIGVKPTEVSDTCFSTKSVEATYGRRLSEDDLDENKEKKTMPLPPVPPKLPPKSQLPGDKDSSAQSQNDNSITPPHPGPLPELPAKPLKQIHVARNKKKCVILSEKLSGAELSNVKLEFEPLFIKASVLQLRKKGKLFSKMMWKQVWLNLRKADIELLKDQERGTLHGLMELAEIAAVKEVVLTVPAGGDNMDDNEGESAPNEKLVEVPGFQIGTDLESWEFRCNDVDEVKAWVAAILHNRSLICG